MRFEYSVPSLAGLDDDVDAMLEHRFEHDGLRGSDYLGAASAAEALRAQMTQNALRPTSIAQAAKDVLKTANLELPASSVEQALNPSSSKLPLLVAGVGVAALIAVILTKKQKKGA